ncbi:hypothetical protein RB595_002489 [Gaeumannomyces hyphopodioides]
MRVNLTTVATLALLGAVSAETPLPSADKLQPGHFPAWVCHAWEVAGAGDTCQVVAERNRLSIDRFVEMNPQIGSAQDCAANLLAGFFYCVSTSPELAPGAGAATGEVPGAHERGPPAARPAPPPPPPPAETQQPSPAASAPPAAAPAPTEAPRMECRHQSDNNCWKMWAIAGPNYSSRFGTFCANVLAETRSWDKWEAVKGLGYPGYKYMDFDCQTKYQANPQALTTLCECLRRGSVTSPAGHPFSGVWCGQYSRCRPD